MRLSILSYFINPFIPYLRQEFPTKSVLRWMKSHYHLFLLPIALRWTVGLGWGGAILWGLDCQVREVGNFLSGGPGLLGGPGALWLGGGRFRSALRLAGLLLGFWGSLHLRLGLRLGRFLHRCWSMLVCGLFLGGRWLFCDLIPPGSGGCLGPRFLWVGRGIRRLSLCLGLAGESCEGRGPFDFAQGMPSTAPTEFGGGLRLGGAGVRGQECPRLT